MNQTPRPDWSPQSTTETGLAPDEVRSPRVQLPKNKLLLAGAGTLILILLMSLGYFATSYLYTPDAPGESSKSPTDHSEHTDQSGRVTEDIADGTAAPDSPTSTPPLPKPTQPAPPPDPPYVKNALVIKYFPLTADGKYIDSSITGDVGNSYPEIRQKTITLTNNLIKSIRASTTYQGFKQPEAMPSIDVKIYKTFEHTKAYPYINNPLYPKHPGNHTPQPKYKIDYQKILTEHAICTYVTKHNVSHVYIWAYSGYGSPTGEIRAWESNMSGPYGNISNSYWEDDMPHCGKTYVVYVFNYGRGTAEALHSWGHQIEREMNAVSPELFTSFRGPEFAGLGKSGVARCGSVHHPPNSRNDYDYNNRSTTPSDCLSGSLDSIGKTTPISCKVWGCEDISDTNNPHLNYQIWLWQNLPGHNNTSRFRGKPIPNMWYAHADFDKAMAARRKTL